MGDVGENGALDSIINLKYFIQLIMFCCPNQKLLWTLHFPSCSSGPLETRCVPQSAIFSTLRTTALGDTANSSVVAHNSLIMCLLFNVIYIGVSICYVKEICSKLLKTGSWQVSHMKYVNQRSWDPHLAKSVKSVAVAELMVHKEQKNILQERWRNCFKFWCHV